MPQIQLKAKLQAYSRAPFYGDYLREPKSLLPDYNPEIAYVFKNGYWVDLSEVSSQLGLSIDDLHKQMAELELTLGDRLDYIALEFDSTNRTLIFTDSSQQKHHFILPNAQIDNITLGRDNLGNMYVQDVPDNKTLKVVNKQYETDVFGVDVKKTSGQLRADALYIKEDPTVALTSSEEINKFRSEYLSGYDIANRLSAAEKNIKDIEHFVQGTGGFLDPFNFGKSLVYLDIYSRKTLLDKYAYDQLFSGIPQAIPDQTKIKNTYTGNIWVYVQEKDTWINEGQDTIVTATNDGVLGSVTGVEYNLLDPNTKFKISIEKDSQGLSTGIMTVNGLQQEFDTVVYKTDGDTANVPNTYVKRTYRGAIVAEASVAADEVVNQGQIQNVLDNLMLADNIITSIVNDEFEIMQNHGGIN